MTSIIFIVIATTFLHVSWGLTDECTKVRTPCDAQQIVDQDKSIAPCVYSNTWVNCIASAISAAAATGKCDPLTVSTYRRDAFQMAQVYIQYCPNIVMPATLQQDNCAMQQGACGTQIMLAYSGKTREQICEYISEFNTCMTKQTQACVDKQNVESLLLEQLYEYQTCPVVSSSLTPQCNSALTPCIRQQIIDQNNKLDDCQIAINYFRCADVALQNAGQNGACGRLALYTIRYNTGLEADSYVPHCPKFQKPASLFLDYCYTEIGICGVNNFLEAHSENSKGNLGTVCSKLSGLKDCMTNNTAGCANRIGINNMVKRELTYFQQKSTCTPLWSSACESLANPCSQQQVADQRYNFDFCTIKTRYLTCLANVYSQAEAGQERCSQIQLATIKFTALQEAQLSKSFCIPLQIPEYLTSLTPCEKQLATCGPSLMKLHNSNTNDEACRNLTVFVDCMENNTPLCSNRRIVFDIIWKADKDYCAGNSLNTSTTISTPTIATTTTTKTTTTTTTTTARPTTAQPTQQQETSLTSTSVTRPTTTFITTALATSSNTPTTTTPTTTAPTTTTPTTTAPTTLKTTPPMFTTPTTTPTTPFKTAPPIFTTTPTTTTSAPTRTLITTAPSTATTTTQSTTSARMQTGTSTARATTTMSVTTKKPTSTEKNIDPSGSAQNTRPILITLVLTILLCLV